MIIFQAGLSDLPDMLSCYPLQEENQTIYRNTQAHIHIHIDKQVGRLVDRYSVTRTLEILKQKVANTITIHEIL